MRPSSNGMRLQKPSRAQRSLCCRPEQFVKVEDAPRTMEPGGRGSPKEAVCTPRYRPHRSSPALSKIIYCFPTAEIVPEVVSPNTGPSWDLPTSLLVLPQGETCDFSRAKLKPPFVLSSHESFYLRQSKRAWMYREGQRYPREPKASANEQN